MELFYTSRDNIALDTGKLLIDSDEFHHLVRVLRKKSGEKILVTDGNGLRCEARIAEIKKASLECEILAHSQVERPKTEVTVALSLLKAPQRFDLFLEKATELGVSAIIPMVTARTLSQPSSEKVEGKLKRWRTIMLSASRQSKRYHLPQISEPLSFKKALALQGFDIKLIPYELSEAPPGVHCSAKKILFLIGGEGGFTDAEIGEARGAGFGEISLGKTILRAETAAIFAVAFVRTQLLAEEYTEWL